MSVCVLTITSRSRCCRDKKKALLRSGVVPQIVNVVFNIMAEPYEDEDDEEIDEDEAPVPVHAGFIIQSFAMHLSATVCMNADLIQSFSRVHRAAPACY